MTVGSCLRLGFGALLLVHAAAGCSPGSEGRLVPEPGAGVSVVDKPEPTARLRSGPLLIGVSGFWASRGSQLLYLSYANRGSTAIRVPMHGLALRNGSDSAELMGASDETGYDPAGSTRPVPLTGPAKDISIPAGGTGKVMAEFGNFAMPDRRARAGEVLTVTLPAAGGHRLTVRLRCAP